MRRTELLQKIRMMKFEEAYYGLQEQRLTQKEAARLLEVCDRTFRRYINRYDQGLSVFHNHTLDRTFDRAFEEYPPRGPSMIFTLLITL